MEMNWDAIRLTQAGLSPANEEKQRAFNEGVAKAAEAIDKAGRAGSQLASDCETEWDALEANSSKLRKQSRASWLAALRLVISAPAIHASFEPDLIQRIESCEQGLRKAEDGARRKLRAAGHGPEASPLYAANPQSAEARFEHMVRTSEPVRLAADELEQARHNHRIWTMRREAVSQWPNVVAAELQRFTARALNLL